MKQITNIPKVAQLSDEYARLLAEKQAEYERYKAYRQEMLTYETVKQKGRFAARRRPKFDQGKSPARHSAATPAGNMSGATLSHGQGRCFGEPERAS